MVRLAVERNYSCLIIQYYRFSETSTKTLYLPRPIEDATPRAIHHNPNRTYLESSSTCCRKAIIILNDNLEAKQQLSKIILNPGNDPNIHQQEWNSHVSASAAAPNHIIRHQRLTLNQKIIGKTKKNYLFIRAINSNKQNSRCSNYST